MLSRSLFSMWIPACCPLLCACPPIMTSLWSQLNLRPPPAFFPYPQSGTKSSLHTSRVPYKVILMCMSFLKPMDNLVLIEVCCWRPRSQICCRTHLDWLFLCYLVSFQPKPSYISSKVSCFNLLYQLFLKYKVDLWIILDN